MERVIGIDLGTTNSVVSYYEQGQPVVIVNAEGSKTTPSIVFFKGAEDVVVGEVARRQAAMNPLQTVKSIKRFMGIRYSDMATRGEGIGYSLVASPDDGVRVDLGWAKLSPEEVSAEILRALKRTAEDYFGEPVEQAVVTVPAYFNDNQRAATKRAGELAGLRIARIINEPTAAALAFGLDKSVEQRVAVFDFGGGTFDISILELDRDVFEVKSTRGDTFLGGDVIDLILYKEIAAQFLADTGVDVTQEPIAGQRLLEAVERVKCELSTTLESQISLPFLGVSAEGTPVHLSHAVTRDKLNELIQPLIPRLLDCCREALADAYLDAGNIDHVLLVGGSTRIPIIQEAVRTFFGKEPNRSLNPDEAVSIGAGMQGSIMSGGLREVLLLDVTPLSLGVETEGNVFSVLIPRNSSIPTKAVKTYTTTRDNQRIVKIHAAQGERKKCSENQSLGYFRLSEITPAPGGLPEISVTFQIDANGLLEVSAVEATSGVSKSITIESYSHVSEEKARQMVEAAELAQEEDRLHLRLAYVRHQAQDLANGLVMLIEDTENPPGEDLQRRLREILFKFDVAVASKDLMALEAALGMLRQASKELSERLTMLRLKRMEQ
ncbi:molecular chaperone DnaK [candidate division BRC1 bacterium HGW-BRC1-1]|jgi:molecular chaperone DnaK|nr:MAG: molecular chaperone DnaK [candidate division BRC1 bacterium HGW-BRC1-1]